ncbi:hypothetical protein FJV46_15015 [Arthrobacter agilis]|uniref:hypothetical protein n=1 Tax=Arthrobacter agilis TaxID=37921 RepID=UPI000B35B2FD|nr:hypothetical protein [Arthrobacter agilis]OUM45702.1 hypothetical protein B8W74_00040 [Arthrobacter agilis]PPB47828.1 hypothetical protein CI784_00035 [Arthrobacter agilis]TPV21359.1 hypothetical protein FJV46_15015 [Arthrobacter agilis]VDR32699.1 Uncharacterised protein [Arthrobacter agilis]
MSEEVLEEKGLAALQAERAAHKAAARDVRRLRQELREMRDKAELWEYRAKRYSTERDQLRSRIAHSRTDQKDAAS